MTQKQTIWNYLIVNNKTTMDSLLATTKLPRSNVTQYLHALAKAGYVNLTKGAKEITDIELLKNTGTLAPLFANGIVTDLSTKQEIVISAKNSLNKSLQFLLTETLEAILAIEEQEFAISELCAFIGKNNKAKTYTANDIKRWIVKLEDVGVLADTNNTYRNSRIMLCNKAKAKELLLKIKRTKSYNLVLA